MGGKQSAENKMGSLASHNAELHECGASTSATVSSSSIQGKTVFKSKKTYPSKDDEEAARWIYCQIFKEIYYTMPENGRPAIKEYCEDLYTEEDTFNLIGTRKQLIEEYEWLSEACKNSNPLIALGNLMVEICDYERAEYFFTKAHSSESDTWSRRVEILNDLWNACWKFNQRDQAQLFREQAKKLTEQNS